MTHSAENDAPDLVAWVMPREDARDLLRWLRHNRPLGMPDRTFDGLMDAIAGPACVLPPDSQAEHDFLPVKGHPDDDECTYRSDGTDATYCGRPAADHDHHPNCYQSTGDIPDDLPDDLCDCRILHALQNPLIGPDGFTRLAGNRVIPPADGSSR